MGALPLSSSARLLTKGARTRASWPKSPGQGAGGDASGQEAPSDTDGDGDDDEDRDEDDEKAIILAPDAPREAPAGRDQDRPWAGPSGVDELPMRTTVSRVSRLQFDDDHPCLILVHALACNLFAKVHSQKHLTEVLQLLHAGQQLCGIPIFSELVAEHMPRNSADLRRYLRCRLTCLATRQWAGSARLLPKVPPPLRATPTKSRALAAATPPVSGAAFWKAPARQQRGKQTRIAPCGRGGVHCCGCRAPPRPQ